jgi:hypothetical protein
MRRTTDDSSTPPPAGARAFAFGLQALAGVVIVILRSWAASIRAFSSVRLWAYWRKSIGSPPWWVPKSHQPVGSSALDVDAVGAFGAESVFLEEAVVFDFVTEHNPHLRKPEGSSRRETTREQKTSPSPNPDTETGANC